MTAGRATKESMMRQQSMRRKPLYLNCQLPIGKWPWKYVVSSYGLNITQRGVNNSVVASPFNRYPEPLGVEHAI